MDQRQRDVLWIAAERQRGRSRVRGTTAAVGLAGLTTAGVVAFTLPGSTHSAVTSKGAASPAGASSSSSPAGDAGQSAAPSSEDDAGSGSSSSSSGGSSSNSTPANSVPTPAAAPPQVTSGGS
jgi:hypothetical protein